MLLPTRTGERTAGESGRRRSLRPVRSRRRRGARRCRCPRAGARQHVNDDERAEPGHGRAERRRGAAGRSTTTAEAATTTTSGRPSRRRRRRCMDAVEDSSRRRRRSRTTPAVDAGDEQGRVTGEVDDRDEDRLHGGGSEPRRRRVYPLVRKVAPEKGDIFGVCALSARSQVRMRRAASRSRSGWEAVGEFVEQPAARAARTRRGRPAGRARGRLAASSSLPPTCWRPA